MTYADVCLERAEKATPGNWDVHDGGEYWDIQGPEGLVVSCGREGEVTVGWEDAEFIAHARTDLPELARRLKRAISIIELLQSSGAYDETIFELEAMPEGK